MLSEYLEPEVRSEGRLREVVTNHLCLPPPQEYEERLARLKADYEAEQESRVRLQEDITAMRNSYDVKLSTLEENLRKEKETGVCCRAPPSVFPLSDTPFHPAGRVPQLPPPRGEKTGPEKRGILLLATQLGKWSQDWSPGTLGPKLILSHHLGVLCPQAGPHLGLLLLRDDFLEEGVKAVGQGWMAWEL